jgi:hypothetical protein
LVALAALMAPVACDDDEGAASEVGDTGADDGAAPVGDDGAAGGGEPMGCEGPLGEGACADVTVCDVYTCGGKAAPFNHFGCPRTACGDDDDCPSTERCFAVVLETACRPAVGSCGDLDGVCGCEGADACEGNVEAHCLPTEFYPAAEDCDVGDLDCGDLDDRLAALDQARTAFELGGSAQLVDEVSTCRDRVLTAQAECDGAVAP